VYEQNLPVVNRQKRHIHLKGYAYYICGHSFAQPSSELLAWAVVPLHPESVLLRFLAPWLEEFEYISRRRPVRLAHDVA
jgi:hypothetical protein